LLNNKLATTKYQNMVKKYFIVAYSPETKIIKSLLIDNKKINKHNLFNRFSLMLTNDNLDIQTCHKRYV
jgi:hypothetical protein